MTDDKAHVMEQGCNGQWPLSSNSDLLFVWFWFCGFVCVCFWWFVVCFFPLEKKAVDGVGGTKAVCHQELASYIITQMSY